jgi:hypothetical protein
MAHGKYHIREKKEPPPPGETEPTSREKWHSRWPATRNPKITFGEKAGMPDPPIHQIPIWAFNEYPTFKAGLISDYGAEHPIHNDINAQHHLFWEQFAEPNAQAGEFLTRMWDIEEGLSGFQHGLEEKLEGFKDWHKGSKQQGMVSAYQAAGGFLDWLTNFSSDGVGGVAEAIGETVMSQFPGKWGNRMFGGPREPQTYNGASGVITPPEITTPPATEVEADEELGQLGLTARG